MLKGKRAIIIGERDGIASPAIEECLKTVGVEPIFSLTQCYVWTAAGAMDLEDQGLLKRVIDEHGRDNVVVVLGSPDEESARVYAETVTTGDPSWAGPLAGVSLRLPVYHILEDEIRQEIDPAVYEQYVAMMEMVLDKDAITEAVRSVREHHSEMS